MSNKDLMEFWNLEFIIIYLSVLALAAVLILLFRSKISPRFLSISALILSLMIISYNLIAFPLFIQSEDWKMERLPSDEFLDLFENSLSPTRSSWIYPLIEDYYQGKEMLIPENVVDTLELSLDRLEVQGRLIDVQVIEYAGKITEYDLEEILGLEHINFLNEKSNLSYYFVIEVKDPNSPLLLLNLDRKFVFIPEDLLPEREGNQ